MNYKGNASKEASALGSSSTSKSLQGLSIHFERYNRIRQYEGRTRKNTTLGKWLHIECDLFQCK